MLGGGKSSGAHLGALADDEVAILLYPAAAALVALLEQLVGLVVGAGRVEGAVAVVGLGLGRVRLGRCGVGGAALEVVVRVHAGHWRQLWWPPDAFRRRTRDEGGERDKGGDGEDECARLCACVSGRRTLGAQ